MKKTLLLLFITAICIIQNVKAQKTHEDSTEVINAARRYAAAFRLSNKNLKKFHIEHFPAASDYFKPNSRRTPAALLNDSLFVNTFRLLAYGNALDQRSLPAFRDILLPNHGVPGLTPTSYSSADQLTAQKDAQRFSLSKAMFIRFKAEHFPATSDYFKPAAANCFDPALLNDSLYVQTFRFEAYSKSYHQRAHPVGHAILIGSIVTVGTTLLILLSISLARVSVY